MKKVLLLLSIFTSTALVFAQKETRIDPFPQAFKYQAVVRNIAGNPIINQKVNFQISILQGSATGTAVYVETQIDTTNSFGLANLEIGRGSVVSGTFYTINWGNDSYFVKVEIDVAGGTTFAFMGTTQLLSVPYALYAKTSETSGPAGTSGQTLRHDGTNWAANSLLYNNGTSIGIGTTSPGAKLHIAGGHMILDHTNPMFNFIDGATYKTFLQAINNDFYIGNRLAGNIIFRTSNVNKMSLKDNGWLDLSFANSKVIRSAETDTANVVAVAYGNITSAGVKNADGSTNNFTVSKAGTGYYEITWTNGLITNYAKAAISVTTTYGNARITSWTSSGGGTVLIVKIYDAAGTLVDDAFSFIVFKP
ncbi:MAG: hypothetical protein WC223_06580 [Bacteroidales bacterium]|jgi:hypothetical protein